ncbi:unnamed protein product [Arabidopsis lyrata]|uniref:Predicted protein n=1 Tax=Arabidopsis lyrata subsp. lyrata TaxID=81972 RepID=D7LP45_ARALL|nr:predicted protein [Arabidopsis lyrata subsp. lyrata]CAH8267228.1 unnamed protein product [Arabidopsis lyrata]
MADEQAFTKEGKPQKETLNVVFKKVQASMEMVRWQVMELVISVFIEELICTILILL